MLEHSSTSCMSTQITEGCVLCMSTQSALQEWMPMQFMPEDPNIPWTSHSQCVHQYPNNSPRVLQWAGFNSWGCSDASARCWAQPMKLLWNWWKTPNAPSINHQKNPQDLFSRKRSGCKHLRNVEGEMAEKTLGWRCALGRKQTICKDGWLQDNSRVFLISLILHVFYRTVRNVTSGTRNRSCFRSCEPAACDSVACPRELKPLQE